MMPEKLKEFSEDLEMLTPEQKFEYLIELGKTNPRLSLEKRDERHKVPGCVSEAFIYVEEENGKLKVYGDADALIARGYIALLSQSFTGQDAEWTYKNISEVMEEFLENSKIDGNMLASRVNSFATMIKIIKKEAKSIS